MDLKNENNFFINSCFKASEKKTKLAVNVTKVYLYYAAGRKIVEEKNGETWTPYEKQISSLLV